MVDIVAVERWHVDALSEEMRAEDAAEVMACSGHTPREAVEKSLEISSFARAFVIAGDLVGIMGIVPSDPLGGVCCGWWLSSNKLDRHKKAFIRNVKENRSNLYGLLSRCDILANMVDARYTKSLRWLRWLGFDIAEKPVDFGSSGMPFYLVTKGVAQHG